MIEAITITIIPDQIPIICDDLFLPRIKDTPKVETITSSCDNEKLVANQL